VAERPRLWVVAETYYPEEIGTGFFMTGVAEALTDRFEVGAICSQPTYFARGTRAPWREVRHGVQIFRAWGTTFDKNVLPLRLLNLATITIALTATLLRRLRRGDVVFVVTNPPSLPYLARFAAWLRGARWGGVWIERQHAHAVGAAADLSQSSADAAHADQPQRSTA